MQDTSCTVYGVCELCANLPAFCLCMCVRKDSSPQVVHTVQADWSSQTWPLSLDSRVLNIALQSNTGTTSGYKRMWTLCSSQDRVSSVNEPRCIVIPLSEGIHSSSSRRSVQLCGFPDWESLWPESWHAAPINRQYIYPRCPSDPSSPFQEVSMTSLVLKSSNTVAQWVSSPSIRQRRETESTESDKRDSEFSDRMQPENNSKLKALISEEKKMMGHFNSKSAELCKFAAICSLQWHVHFFLLHRASDKRRNLAQQKAEAQRRLYGQGTMKKLAAGSSEWEKQRLTLERRKEELVRRNIYFFLSAVTFSETSPQAHA